MIKAILTIDDFPSENTKAIVDYLLSKNIKVIFFCWGERLEQNKENAIYALRNGMIVGNHSYTHPHFSELTLEECIAEIEKCEEALDRLYEEAGVPRTVRPFRFPYGDQGGANKEALQEYFKAKGFDKVDDTKISEPGWKKAGYDQDIDTLWTFDLEEYRIRPDSDFTKEDVFAKMEDPAPAYGFPLFKDGSWHLLITHAHDETEQMYPEYYKHFIDRIIEGGVVFEEPRFI
ncbi:MAG: polysaccharide deacetylase family protein [Clostridiales bacterium]|nr:polysaccharide deacetylase family protein [Clostridiales bacterium]